MASTFNEVNWWCVCACVCVLVCMLERIDCNSIIFVYHILHRHRQYLFGWKFLSNEWNHKQSIYSKEKEKKPPYHIEMKKIKTIETPEEHRQKHKREINQVDA